MSKDEFWKEQISAWQASSFSAAAWCREKSLQYNRFLYWKDRLAPQTAQPFVELTDSGNGGSGVELEIKSVVLRVEVGFDAGTLRRCIEVLGGQSC